MLKIDEHPSGLMIILFNLDTWYSFKDSSVSVSKLNKIIRLAIVEKI